MRLQNPQRRIAWLCVLEPGDFPVSRNLGYVYVFWDCVSDVFVFRCRLHVFFAFLFLHVALRLSLVWLCFLLFCFLNPAVPCVVLIVFVVSAFFFPVVLCCSRFPFV